MIRILTKNYHSHLIKRRGIKSIEDESSWGITNAGAILRANEPCQFLKVRLPEFLIQMSLPAIFYPYIH